MGQIRIPSLLENIVRIRQLKLGENFDEKKITIHLHDWLIKSSCFKRV